MDNKQSHQQSEHRKHFGEKLLALPGIGDTIDLVREHAWVRTVDEASNKGAEGELGAEVRQIIKKPTVEALQKFLSHEIVEMYMNDNVDEWLELLAFEAGPKIAELWNMSEAAGQRLSRIIYWGEHSLMAVEANISPVVLLLEEENQLQIVKDHRQELQDKGVITTSTNQVQKGHVYLDVTELPYGSFRSAYKVIGLIRRYLGIKKKDLQELLLKHCHLKLILDNQRRRSFAQADINTIIALFSPPDEKSTLGLDRKARFVMFRVPFEEVLSPIVFQEIDEAHQLTTDPKHRQLQVPVFGTNETIALTELSRPEFRVRALEQADLYRDGLGSTDEKTNLISTEAKYDGGKWGGKYLRAPEIFWTLLEKGKHKFDNLATLALVGTYLNTGGADDFFFVKVSECLNDTALIESRCSTQAFEVERKYLRTFLESPRQLQYIDVSHHDLDTHILVIPKGESTSSKKVKSYLEYGEKRGFHLASGRKGKSPWYLLPKEAFGGSEILWPARVGDKHYVYFNPQKIVSHRFYRVTTKEESPEVLCAVLNATTTSLFSEILAGASLGEGVHDISGITIKMVPVLNSLELSNYTKQQLLGTFVKLRGREIRSIFEEVGLPKPNKDYSNINPKNVSLDEVLPDRRELDKIVFEAIGLTEKEQLEVYRAVVELVRNRLVKAGSV